MKYLAIWQLPDKEILVLPRSKKRNTFDNIQVAEAALEKQARHYPDNTRGIIKDIDGNVIRTVAL